MKVTVDVDIKIFRAIKNEFEDLNNREISSGLKIICNNVIEDLYEEGELFSTIKEVT